MRGGQSAEKVTYDVIFAQKTLLFSFDRAVKGGIGILFVYNVNELEQVNSSK
jgi:hypothetical protein